MNPGHIRYFLPLLFNKGDAADQRNLISRSIIFDHNISSGCEPAVGGTCSSLSGLKVSFHWMLFGKSGLEGKVPCPDPRGLGQDPHSLTSSFGHVPGRQVWLWQVIHLFPWVFSESPLYKCQILRWSFQFLLDRAVSTFLSLQGTGNYNLVIKFVGGLVIPGCRSSPAGSDCKVMGRGRGQSLWQEF